MSYEERTEKGMINVLRPTELWKSKPKHNNSLEKVIESYHKVKFIQGVETYATSTK